MISDQTRRKKSREVSSRYLYTTVTPPSPPLGFNHNNHPVTSPNHHNPKPKQKHKHTGFIRGLWPSSASKNDLKRSENTPVLSKQKSCTEFRHSEKIRNTRNSLKEHNTPVFGNRSMRFTGKLLFPGRPSMSSMNSSNIFDPDQSILPGRLSVDENALRRRTDSFSDNSEVNSEANSEASDVSSPYTTGRKSLASYMAPTLSSRKLAVDVPRCISPSISMHNSPKGSKVKRTMKRGGSLSKTSLEMEWESSPSRSLGSPLFSSSKPPTSSVKGRKNLLHIGLDLIKGKKGGSKLQSPLGSDTGTNNMENVHRLRLMQNSLMQWRYVNARAEHVHESLAAQSENKLFCGTESVAKLRESVIQKRLQVQKEKQEVKLSLILHSQIKMLEAWGDIERRHMLDVSVIKDYLHAVVCTIPLIEGAKVDLESATMAFEDTSHMVASIQSMLSSVSPTAHETMVTLSELADVVTQEKLLLEECFEHLEIISTLEIQERNLRCGIITMDSSDEQQQQKE
ncbi:putative QWRF family protein [Helianthus debilis subsp. tardiflorus]